MKFKTLFLAILIASSLILAAVYLNQKRPAVERKQPSAEFVRATGKCFECHSHETSAITEQYSKSVHAQKGVSCLDCHTPQKNQKSKCFS